MIELALRDGYDAPRQRGSSFRAQRCVAFGEPLIFDCRGTENQRGRAAELDLLSSITYRPDF
jgi:hypothetical protein